MAPDHGAMQGDATVRLSRAPGRGRLGPVIAVNYLANLAGALTQPLLAILLVPVFIGLLGLEVAGLLGFFGMLDLLLALFTRGIGTSIQREIARRCHDPAKAVALPALLRTFARLYWGISLTLGLALVAAAWFIAHHWLEFATVTPMTVAIALMLVAVRISVAFPAALYQSLLMATERQVSVNAVNVASALVGNGVALLVIWLRPEMLAYVAVTVGVAAATTCTHRVLAGRALRRIPGVDLHGRAPPGMLGEVWRMSVGMMAVHGANLLLQQIDRWVLSAIVPVARLAIYDTGAKGGRLVQLAVQPFAAATYPQLCRLADGEPRAFHARTARLVATAGMLVCAAGIPLACHADTVLELWMALAPRPDPSEIQAVIADGTPVLRLYAIGAVCRGAAWQWQQTQWAEGRFRPSAWFNALAVVVMIPACLWAHDQAGLAGVAWAWVGLGIATFVFHAIEAAVRGRFVGRAWIFLPWLAAVAGAMVGLHLVMRHLVGWDAGLGLRVVAALVPSLLVGMLVLFGAWRLMRAPASASAQE